MRGAMADMEIGFITKIEKFLPKIAVEVLLFLQVDQPYRQRQRVQKSRLGFVPKKV
jgi:hypothetical protein